MIEINKSTRQKGSFLTYSSLHVYIIELLSDVSDVDFGNTIRFFFFFNFSLLLSRISLHDAIELLRVFGSEAC